MNVWSLNPLKENEEKTPHIYFANKLEFGSKSHLWVGKYYLKKFFDPLHFQDYPSFVIFSKDQKGDQKPLTYLIHTQQYVFLSNQDSPFASNQVLVIDRSSPTIQQVLGLVTLDDKRLEFLKSYDGRDIMKEGVIQFSLSYLKNDKNRLIGMTEIKNSELDPFKFIERD